MQKWNLLLLPSCATLKMHQARHVRRDDAVWRRLLHEGQLVVAHLGGYCLFGYREGSTETATFVHAIELGKCETGNPTKEGLWFGEDGIVHPFCHRCHIKTPNGRTTCMDRNLVFERRPRELPNLKDVMQE